MSIENARISSAFLGIEDHGLLTAMIHLEGKSWSQGFGGNNFGGSASTPAQAANLAIFIRRVLAIVEVDSWEKLPGKLVRIKRRDDYQRIDEIGGILEEKWFDPEKEFQR